MGLPDPLADAHQELTSGLLPIICHLLEVEPGCNVVDLGACIGNCAAFSGNGARVFIDTSHGNLRARVIENGELEPGELEGLLAHCPDEIDVVLLWDILDYLPLESIRNLMRGFSGIMRPGGLAYAMVSRQRYISSAPAVIDVVREDLLRFHYQAPFDKEAPQYAPKKLEQQMPGFVLEKLYLLQNGVQEHLFLFEGFD